MTEPINAATPQDTAIESDLSGTQDNISSEVENDSEVSTLLGTNDDKGEKPDAKEEAKTDGKEDSKVVPEKYEIKLKEGLELDKETLDIFEPLFKELGLTNEGAQKLADAYVPIIQSYKDNFEKDAGKRFKDIVDGWKADTMKELGSDATVKLAKANKAIDRVGSMELRELLDRTGVGNSKEFVRMMVKVSEALGEDNLSDTQGSNPKGADALLRSMYPTMKQ